MISIHALLAESDGIIDIINNVVNDFYPRSPCGERHTWARGSRVTYVISIHALLAESDRKLPIRLPTALHFYPRSPCGERLVHALKLANPMLFLSTLSLRRATSARPETRQPYAISIHALLAESDGIIDIINNVVNDFYPRSPCGERQLILIISPHSTPFLSTLSLRRATAKQTNMPDRNCNFYPRSPCGERPDHSGG